MIDYTKTFSRVGNKTKNTLDAGLKAYMVKIYQYMATGLFVTSMVAFMSSKSMILMNLIYNTGFGFVFMFAPLFLGIYFSMNSSRMSLANAKIFFWVYAGFMGLSLSYIFMMYTGHSVMRTLLISTSFFGGISIYGHTTERDLTSMGSFFIMGLIGIVIASLINIVLKSTAIHFVTSFLGVFIFLGLIAYDTQKLKRIYYTVPSPALAQKFALLGAFTLYLDFINLFLHLLRFLGDRKN